MQAQAMTQSSPYVEWDAGENAPCFLILLWPALLTRAVCQMDLNLFSAEVY